MVRQTTRSDPDRRWSLLMHALFGVTVAVPTATVAITRPPGLAVTLLFTAALVGWYAAFVWSHPSWHERTGVMLLYAAGALALFTALVTRQGQYFILIYALLPQFFSLLPRGAAVLGVAGIVLLPAAVTGGIDELLADPDQLFNLLANVGLGLAVTAVIEAFGRQSAEQKKIIAELEQARAENERLLGRAQRDLRNRDALAWTGHALIAARSAEEVAAALVEHLARHAADVRGVALLSHATDGTAEVLVAVPGTAGPQVGALVTVPDRPSGEMVTLSPVHRLPHAERARLAGVTAAAVLPLHSRAGGLPSGPTDPTVPALLWIGVAATDQDASMLRDLSTVATETAFALANLRLAAHAADQGRIAGVLAERQRLAHEIHDTLAQGFTSIVTQLEAADQALRAAPDIAATHLDRARTTARDSLTEARRTVEALRPQPLDDVTLTEAIREVTTRWGDAQGGSTDVAVRIDGTAAPIPAETEVALLRVVQEALANIARHAQAEHVRVTLSYLDDLVLVDVADDGVGFDSSRLPHGDDVSRGGYGLIAMRERMEQLGGRLVVESVPGEGTSVAASVPLGPSPVEARPRLPAGQGAVA